MGSLQDFPVIAFSSTGTLACLQRGLMMPLFGLLKRVLKDSNSPMAMSQTVLSVTGLFELSSFIVSELEFADHFASASKGCAEAASPNRG